MGFHKLGTPSTWLFLQQFKAWAELHYPNPLKSKTWQCHLSQMWTWCGKMGLGMEAKIRLQLKPHTSPMLVFLNFCRVNEGICKLWLNGTSPRICPFKRLLKNHLKHTWYGFKTYKPFPSVIFGSVKVNCFCVF
jgi:hypothetical protein